MFHSDTFRTKVRLSLQGEFESHFNDIKSLDRETMEKFEIACAKIILKLFQMSECIFIEKTNGDFEQKSLLYGSSNEFSDLFGDIISSSMVRISVYGGLREYFNASIKTMLRLKKKKDVLKRVALTKAQAAHEVQMFGGWALHGLQSVDKSNTLKHWAIRQM